MVADAHSCNFARFPLVLKSHILLLPTRPVLPVFWSFRACLFFVPSLLHIHLKARLKPNGHFVFVDGDFFYPFIDEGILYGGQF